MLLSSVNNKVLPLLRQWRCQRGMSLIEILMALAIMALAGVAFLAGMTTMFRGVMVSQNHVNLESLAKSQIDYVKSQPYDDVNNPPQYLTQTENIPGGYSIGLIAMRLDPRNDGTDADDGLQEITVTVNHVDSAGNTTLLTVSDYMVQP
jgi:prepilin-type N-terminal cleavage/methylation domain-containing protein